MRSDTESTLAALALGSRRRLARPGAQITYRAGGAGGLAGEAGAPAVNYEEVRRLCPSWSGEKGAEIVVYLLRVLRPGEPEPLAHARHVRVHGNGGDTEGVAQHHVGGFAPHTGERDEFLHGAGHHAAMTLHQRLPHAYERPRLGLEEARGVDLLLEGRGACPLEVLRRPISREERPGHRVHPLVRALSGEDGGGQKLEGRGEVELDPRRRICLGETPEDLHGPGLPRLRRLRHYRFTRGRRGSVRCAARLRPGGVLSARGSRAIRAGAARDRWPGAARDASGCAAPGCPGAHSSS